LCCLYTKFISSNTRFVKDPYFGLENVGKIALIHPALYGGKAAGQDFKKHLRECIWCLGYTACLADPDVWM
jgi:hypothetical protein